MRKHSLLRLPGLLFVALCLFAAAAWAQALQPVPALAARVTDQTGTLSAAERSALESRLGALETRKGSQLAVLIVPTTRPEAIEQFSIRVVDAWQLGREGVDDGVLLLVAKSDREMRIEVGRGLEGAIPDAIAKRIIAEQITPHFRDGRFADGLNAGVDAIIARIDGEPLPEPVRRAPPASVDSVSDLLFQTVFIAFFAAPFLRAIFGRLLASGVGAAAGGLWWFLSTSALTMAGVGAVVAALAVLLVGSGRGGGPWTTGSGHGGGFGSRGGGWSSGGGFSGGGGGFSGGGASGRW
ncbi:TPM domain-containing protein [Denitromonas iodatirespirans]|uniref:YgcG family protein n=1 Tax=Denitromonas iodatirespirans TaxID=2795389 RepID=A0A944DL40_DENI1|nr:YgcG family protein [Denitromonas iodatirespirans]MBT0960709.1 YgcG family protein [Denitromonas iodatirespirans]